MSRLKYLFMIIYRPFSSSLKQYCQETLKTKPNDVLLHSVADLQELSVNSIKIEIQTIGLLKRLSLVDCVSKKRVKSLEEAIQFADTLFHVDVTDVEPLTTILEDIALNIREDKITEGDCKEEILKNASVTEDEYFITPPGNLITEVTEK